MIQQTLFKIRDMRQKTQFKIDDAYLNGYARICGKDATIVYTSLCRHAEFNTQKAFPSQEKIGYEHGISVRTVRRGFKMLLDYNIILAEQVREKGKFINYLYTLLDKSEWKKIAEGQNSATANHRPQTVGRLAAYGVGPTKDNKEQRITNIKDNKDILATPLVVADNINSLIELFKEVNPTYKRLFADKSQRGALERLVKQFGQEKVKNMIDYLPKIFGKPYAPRITTPYILEKKLADLMAYIKSRSQEKITLVDLSKK